MHIFTRPLAAAAAVVVVTGGVLGLTGSANAAPFLHVSLSSHGFGASARWSPAGDPVLTVGAPSATTYAQVKVTNAPRFAPFAAPSFVTDHYTAGSPHWVITFSGGAKLLGYPSAAGFGSLNWEAVPPVFGHFNPAPKPHDAYLTQLGVIQKSHYGGFVTSATIVANDFGASTIKSINYAGMTLVPGPDHVIVSYPGLQHGTIGQPISPLKISAYSVKGDGIAWFQAFGLPTGLHLNQFTGVITGSPVHAGFFPMTMRVFDNGGTVGFTKCMWQITAARTVVYSGTIRLPKLGLFLDDRYNSSASGAVVQVWRGNGSPAQQWQVMSDGTIWHNGLVLTASGSGDGARLYLSQYTGSGNQKWDTASWRIHYNPTASSKVVDDPAFGGPGTQLIIYTENGGANQYWATY